MSKEKLEELVNEQLAQAIADQVFNRLQEKWDRVVSELASTRKTSTALSEKLERLEATVTEQSAVSKQLNELVESFRQYTAGNKRVTDSLEQYLEVWKR